MRIDENSSIDKAFIGNVRCRESSGQVRGTRRLPHSIFQNKHRSCRRKRKKSRARKIEFRKPIQGDWVVQSPLTKISLAPSGKSAALIRASCPDKRGASRSSRTLVQDAMDADGVARRAIPTRTAKSCGPVPPTLGSSFAGVDPRDDGGKRARSPGRARISRNTVAQETPDCSVNLR